MKSTVLSIGELADLFGLATHVLRHWEAAGLLAPSRLGNGRRLYHSGDVTRVALIMAGKDVGLSLEQMRATMEAPDGDHRRKLMRAHRDDLQRRIDRLRRAQEMVDHALQCAAPDPLECPVLLSYARSVRLGDRGADRFGAGFAGAAGEDAGGDGPAAGRGGECDRAADFPHDLRDDRQPEPGAGQRAGRR